MKGTVIIIISVILLLLGVGRVLLTMKHQIEDEKVSYIRNLDYNFSAVVDSVTTVGKKGRGFLVCKQVVGKVNPMVEDSLNQRLSNYEWMRFLFFEPNGPPQVFLDNVSDYRAGDSIVVDSDNDKFVVYRNQTIILQSQITNVTWQKMSFEAYTNW